ncbi:MAG: glutaredoxin domain-containing protein [Polaromonas sp.]
MPFKTLNFLAPRALLALAAAASLAAPWAQAQQVFRIVGPDGKVTFSDQPPPSASTASNGKVSEAGVSAATAGTATAASTASTASTATAALPFELRQVPLKYPVTLYANDSCAPCGAARSMLTSRGIPFSEKTVTTAADTEALQRLSGEASLPFLTIGSQQLKGFSDAEWTQFLNAAGYPARSVLPANYRAPAPKPLVTQATAAPAVASPNAGATAEAEPAKIVPANTRPATRPAARPPEPQGNPAGIRF